MNKNRVNIPVVILILMILCAMPVLFTRFQKGKEEKKNASAEKERLTIICPKLKECADAFLLMRNGEAILIDTGESADGKDLEKLLQEEGVTSLKAMILTHFDKDHIGSAARIIKHFPVEKCYMTCGSEDSEEYEELMGALTETGLEGIMLTETFSFRALNADFTIYPPLQGRYNKTNDNNLSLITKISYQGHQLLFLGDAEKERMMEFFGKQYDETQYEVVKFPHHGRETKTAKALLSHFHPDHVIITSSTEEMEKESVMKVFKKAEVNTWLTREGRIVFRINADGIDVEQ